MATDEDAKLALGAVSDDLTKLSHVTGLGVGSSDEVGKAVLLVYLNSAAVKEDESLRALIPSSVEIQRPDGSRGTVPVQTIDQDELGLE